jgi:hypothetical protein
MRDPYKLPKRSDKAIAAVAHLQQEIGKIDDTDTYLQAFGFIFEKKDGTVRTKNLGSRICFACLDENITYHQPDEKAVFMVDWSTKLLKLGVGKPNWYTKEECDYTCSRYDAERFAKWAAHDSIWRRAFVTKDIPTLISKPVIYNTMHPLRFVLQAAMLLRTMHERPWIIHTWELFEKHIDSNVAFYLANLYKWDRKKQVIYAFENQGHSLFNGASVDRRQVLTSLHNRDFSFMRAEKSAEKQTHNYRKLERIWAPQYEIRKLNNPPATWENKPIDNNNLWNNHSRYTGWKITDEASVASLLKELVELNLLKREPENA